MNANRYLLEKEHGRGSIIYIRIRVAQGGSSMSLSPMENNLVDFTWPEAGMPSVASQVFCDPAVYAREQERIFRGKP